MYFRQIIYSNKSNEHSLGATENILCILTTFTNDCCKFILGKSSVIQKDLRSDFYRHIYSYLSVLKLPQKPFLVTVEIYETSGTCLRKIHVNTSTRKRTLLLFSASESCYTPEAIKVQIFFRTFVITKKYNLP